MRQINRRIVTNLLVLNFAFGCLGSALAQGPAAQDSVPQAKPSSDAVVIETTTDGAKTEAAAKSEDKDGWLALLPASGLEGWKVTDFGGQGEVVRDEEQLILEVGDPLTGITYTGQDFPTSNYEVEFEAKRIEGNDFLAGLTFPVGKEFCSFIAGGWGGGLVGLSNLDGFDASENSSSSYFEFKNDQWYKFHLRVDEAAIQVTLDGRKVIDEEREHHTFSTRIEVYASQPLGYCVYRSKVAVRGFRYRKIKAESVDSKPVESETPKAEAVK